MWSVLFALIYSHFFLSLKCTWNIILITLNSLFFVFYVFAFQLINFHSICIFDVTLDMTSVTIFVLKALRILKKKFEEGEHWEKVKTSKCEVWKEILNVFLENTRVILIFHWEPRRLNFLQNLRWWKKIFWQKVSNSFDISHAFK